MAGDGIMLLPSYSSVPVRYEKTVSVPIVSTATDARERALKSISKLPPFSAALNKLMASLADEDVSFAELADVIEKDAVLAGAVLRTVNSAIYARRGTVSSVRHALAVLGVSKLRNITISLSLAQMWNSTTIPGGWSVEQFNLHAVAVAILADLLAAEMESEFPEGAFTGGLLANVGMLLIAIGAPQQYAEVQRVYRKQFQPLEDCERDVLGFHHAELSAETLRQWRLPDPIVTAVAAHHTCDEPGKLAYLLAKADLVAARHTITVQPWMQADPAAPADVLSEIGLGEKADSILQSFQDEYNTLKAFFR